MIAGPGAAYICDDCLQLCNDILHDATPFSAQALELASRPPVVMAMPQPQAQERGSLTPRAEPVRVVTLELEQKQQGRGAGCRFYSRTRILLTAGPALR